MNAYHVIKKLSAKKYRFFRKLLHFTGTKEYQKYNLTGSTNVLVEEAVFPDGFKMAVYIETRMDEPSYIKAILLDEKGSKVNSCISMSEIEWKWELSGNGRSYVFEITFEENHELPLEEVASNMIDEMEKAYEILKDNTCAYEKEELLLDMSYTLYVEAGDFIERLNEQERRLQQKEEELKKLKDALNETVIVNGSLQSRGEDTYWCIDTSSILKKLQNRAHSLCDTYASDLLFLWNDVKRRLENGSLGNAEFLFAFHESGVHGDKEYIFRNSYCYREIWTLKVSVIEDQMEMVLKRYLITVI